jgi:hypothetical protein
VSPALTTDDGRRAAAAYRDPELLFGQDLIRYAEALMREDHRVLAPDFQFWGGVADWLNHIACVPDKPAATLGERSRFSGTVSTAVGYIRMSTASQEVRLRLLRDYFPPQNNKEPESTEDKA